MSNTSSGSNLQAISTSFGAPSSYVHPEYTYWAPEWKKIRDCLIGEVEVKRQTTEYLDKLPRQSSEEYTAYLKRATFFNMTDRTINGLLGTLFNRPPKLEGIPKKHEESFNSISKDNLSLDQFIKLASQEVLTTGRYGVLVDRTEGENEPYFAGYTAENILNWRKLDIGRGRNTLIEVVLREIVDKRQGLDANLTSSSTRYEPRYRVLRLVTDKDPKSATFGDVVYQQHVYLTKNIPGMHLTSFARSASEPNLLGEPDFVVTPTRRGKPLDYIPFEFFGVWSNDADVDKPPLLDITLLNLSHYRSYAELEQGRFYTANPMYHAHVPSGEASGEYELGAARVWEYSGDRAPGILEFNGQGLIFLENALKEKQSQASSLGGRMLGTESDGPGESDNVVALKEKNERSLLLNMTSIINEGTTQLVQWWLWWQNASQTEIVKAKYTMDQNYLSNPQAAREFRAVAQMYKDGHIPINVFYSYFHKAEVIPVEMTQEEFVTLLEEADQFPNQVDTQAHLDGFPDASTKFTDENPPDPIVTNTGQTA